MTPLAPVSAIADVLALWGLDGWLTPPLVPVVAPAGVVAGRACTVQVGLGALGPGLTPLQELLSGDLSGRVLVVAGAQPVPGAVFGELLAASARQQGAVAVAVDGWVRDRPDMGALGLPVLAAGERVVGPNGRAHVTAVGDTVVVGSVSVADGDLVVLDATGAVRIPADREAEVLDAAWRYAAAELRVAGALAAGEPLLAAYVHKKSVLEELRR